MTAPSERAAAKALGLSRYFTGKPCLRNHIAERRTSDGGCVVCKVEDARGYDARNREKRRAMNRDRRRAKHQDNPKAQAERLEKFRAWQKQRTEPKPISLVAYEGPNEVDDAEDWLRVHARRLGVEWRFIMDAIRKGWTLVEIEKLPREDVAQLADNVNEHKHGAGFTRWEDYNPVLDVGETY